MKRLIINADDLGLTAGVTAGIRESMLRGAVATTSAMLCAAGSLGRLAACAAELRGRIGVHLQLTDGIPCADAVPSLIHRKGRFPRLWPKAAKPRAEDIRREWRAQLDRALDLGIRPTHIDTHHHVHRFPRVFEVYCEIADAYRLPARALTPGQTSELRRRGVRCADYCEASWYEDDLTPDGLLRYVEEVFARPGCETVELMCHPAYCDEDLRRKSDYAEGRERELRALCDPSLPRLLERAGVVLAGRGAHSARTLWTS